jgi:hypothetical protein
MHKREARGTLGRDDRLEFVLASFTRLEDELLTCMSYVPYIDQNRDVVSPRFTPILMESCSLIDSIFRYQSDTSQRHALKDFAAEHEAQMELEDATSLLLVSPLAFVRPFAGWGTTAPDWWLAHNLAKHDRIRNHEAVTYRFTVESLVALHQVIARSWLFLGHLARWGWFNADDDDGLVELAAARASSSGPPSLPVESRLIVSSIRDSFVEYDGDVPRVTDETPWRFSRRVEQHIWENEGW